VITDCYEALEVGQRHATRARTVTETDLVNFAGLTGDWHPLHTDAEFAAADPTFGRRIAHGALVLSIGLGLVTLRPEAVTAFYGIDRLRFVGPTFIGDTIHVETEIQSITPRADRRHAVVASQFVVRNQRGSEALIGTLAMLVAGRAAA
jgi:3-hydroxybutyryl-CoA dehydratase